MDAVYKQQIIIQLGVDGDNIIDSVRQRLDAVKQVMEGYAEQVKQGRITQDEYLQNTRDLGDEMVRLKGILATNLQQMDSLEGKMKGGAFAILAMSHAAQDFVQSGFPAVINNIPQITFGIGQLAGWSTEMNVAISGISMVVGLVANAAIPTVRQIGQEFGLLDDPSKHFLTTIKDTEAALKAMQAKPWKVEFDLTEISHLEAKLKEMERSKRLIESAGTTDVQARAAKDAQEAVTVFGGGSNAILKAIGETEMASGQFHGDATIDGQISALKQKIANYTPRPDQADMRPEWQRQIRELEAKRAQTNAAGTAAFAQSELGAFLAGDFDAIQRMQGRTARNPGTFGMAGPGGLRFDEFVKNMAGSGAEQRRRMDQDVDDQDMLSGDAAQLAQFKRDKQRAQQEEQKRGREIDADNRQDAQDEKDNEKHYQAYLKEHGLDPRSMSKAEKEKARSIAKSRATNERNAAKREKEQGEYQQFLAKAATIGNRIVNKFGLDPSQAGEIGQNVLSYMNNHPGMGESEAVDVLMFGGAGGQAAGQRQLQGMARQQMGRSIESQQMAGGMGAQMAHKIAQQTLNLMDKGLDVQTAQAAAIQQMQQQMQQIQMKLNGLQQTQQRGRQRNPSLLSNFPPGVR